MTRSAPFILEGSLSVDARMLVYAKNIQEAAELLEAKNDEIRTFLEKQIQSLALNAMMEPDKADPSLTFFFDCRPAEGHEVAGSDAIKPDVITLDSCNHEDHDHDEEAA